MIRILRKTSILAILLICGFMTAKTQPIKRVTVVPALYVTDSATFATATGWVYKSSLYDSRWEPTKQLNDKDSSATVVKKEYQTGDATYYIKVKNPANKVDSIKNVNVLIEFINPYKH